MSYTVEGDNVFYENTVLKKYVGTVEKIETVRIDDETVEDVGYTFDLIAGDYVEISRTTRHEPLSPPEPTTDEIQMQTLLNTEFLVVLAELQNM